MAKTKMQFEKAKAKSAKAIKEKKAKGGGFGNFLWIKADTSKMVALVAEPKDWIEYKFVGLEKGADGEDMQYRKLPCYKGYGDDFEGAGSLRVRTAYAIPVVEIDEDGKRGDRVMYYEPGAKVLDELLTTFEKRGTLTDRDLEIIREGSGKNGTSYTLYWHDPDPKRKARAAFLEKMIAKLPDIDDDFIRMVEEAATEFNKGEAEDEDDETPKKGKKSAKSKAAKKRVMEDEDDDEESEEEEPEEDDAADDAEDDGDDDEAEEDEDDDSEDDDSEDDEDDDDEEEGDDELPTEDEVKAMEFKELKAFALENDVEVKAGSKSKGYREAILEWLEENGGDEDDSDDDDEEDGDEEGEKRVESTFVLTNIDTTSWTADLEDADGNEYETVYFDRERDKLGSYKDGGKYKFIIEMDEQQDWLVETMPVSTAKPKKGSAKSTGKKGSGKKSKK